MATHSNALAWKIPWTEKSGRLQSMGSQRVGHDWVTSLSLFTFTLWRRKWQPTPVFLPGESQGWRSLVGCRLWGCTGSDTTEATWQQQQQQQLSYWASLIAQLVIGNAGDPGSIPGSGRSAGEGKGYPLQYSWASLVAQLVKNQPAMWETWVRSLGWEDPLEKGKASHSSLLAQRIPWTVWNSMGSQRIPWCRKESDMSDRLSLYFHSY